MGDPETQVVLPRLSSDLLQLFEATASGKLVNGSLEVKKECAVTVVKVSGGYPEDYKKGFQIKGLDNASDSLVFHAGTRSSDKGVETAGGRVLAITGIGVNLKEARDRAYTANALITWEDEFFRKDIGLDLIKRGQN
jgi:phosphoribosylamine--glycine ligase